MVERLVSRQGTFMVGRLWVGAIASWILGGALGSVAQAQDVCTYNPDLGPNPLGMRAFITLTETTAGTTVLFEQLPTLVGGAAEQPVTLTIYREMIFYGLGVQATREFLAAHADYYQELVGYPDPEGFGPVDAVLSCSAESPLP
ncbi:MAG TPA: hypothetical protein IGR64_16990 [Leptolyngbyaceae cyanobacterium M65_K2018_010]|nr:hypothetical protein [Leptolyngbyaceae cyanobacterium M65_K2018_010]